MKKFKAWAVVNKKNKSFNPRRVYKLKHDAECVAAHGYYVARVEIEIREVKSKKRGKR